MDNLQILIEAILSLKDITKSKQQIMSELPKLESQLQSDKKARVNITAGIDINKSKNLIQAQLNTLANQAKAPIIKVGIDTSSIKSTQEITNELKSTNKQIQQTSSSLTNLADKFKEPIKPTFDNEGLINAEKTISKVQQHFQELGNVSVKGIYSDKEAVDSLDKMVVSIKNGQKEARTLTFELDKAGKAFYLTSGTSDNSGIEKFIESVKKAKDKLKAIRIDLASTLKSIGTGYSDPNSVKPIVDDTHIKNLNNQYVHALRSIAELKNADNTTMASMKANAEKEIDTLKRMVKEYQNAEYAATSLRTKDISTVKESQTNDLNKFIAQINSAKIPIQAITSDIETLKTSLVNVTDKESLTAYLNQFDVVKTKFDSIKVTYNSIADTIKQLTALQNNTVFNKNASNPQVIQTKQEITQLLAEYQKLMTQMQGNITPEGLKSIGNQLTKLNADFNSVTTSAKSFEQSLKTDNGAEKFKQKVSILTAQIKEFQKVNTRSLKQYGDEYNRMLKELTNPNLDTQGLDKIRVEFQNIKREINTAGIAGKNFFGRIKEQAAKFASWMSLTGVITGAWHEVKKMVTNVVELDSAMTNLKKVTDETETTYSRFLKNASQQAKNLHSDITDLVEQTSTWAKLGYNLEQANKAAQVSMIYSKVGEVDNEQAVTNIVSAIKAFDIAIEDVMKIPDVYNKLGNSFAVSSKNLGSGMSQAATTMALAGNNFEQVAALLTGAGEILGDDRLDEIGTGLKTVTLRIQNQAGALKELGEEYEDLISVSKTQQQIFQLTGGKVNIMSDTNPNEFRDTYSILKDIAGVIKELDGTTSSELVQLLFGKNRANVGTAVLKAFQSGQIDKAYEAAKNSAGSAQEEFDRWSQSIEAHLNTLSASFQSLSQTVVNSDFIKFIVDSGTNILNIIEEIIKNLGTIPTILTSIAAVKSFQNVGELSNTPSYALLQLCA